MKKIVVFIFTVLLIASCATNSQTKNQTYFEGNIKYKLDYGLKTDKVTAQYLDSIFGKTADVYFKDGNIFEMYNGGIILQELYRKDDNKNYLKYNTSDTVKWTSCSLPEQEIISYEINPKKETIMGIVCDEYVAHYKHRTNTYYFNSDTLKLNPDWYKQFTLTNKNMHTERMKANYLKFKLEYKDFWVSFTATSITPKLLDSKMFDLKPGSILVKDPSYN